MRLSAQAWLLVFAACGGDLPRPPYVGQGTDALSSVDYPPPPARVEFIPKRPASGAVWIDGEWSWRGRRWAWKPGRWVVGPAGTRFSPWTMVRGGDGTIYVAGGVWRDDQNRVIPDPSPLATGRPNAGPIDDPEGEPEPTGHTLRTSQPTEPPEVAPVDGGTGGRGD